MTAPSSSEKEPRCFICGESAPLRCASCKRVSYCGKGCQIAHWKLAHRKECKHFMKARMDAPTDDASAREALCSLQDRVSSMSIREAIAEMRRAQAEVDRLKKTKDELCQAVQRAKDDTEDAQGAAELARNIAMLAGKQSLPSNHAHTSPTTPMASVSGGSSTQRHTGSSHGEDEAEGVEGSEEGAQPTYAQCEYWEARYRSEAGGTYEWYVGYDELKDLCHTHIPREDPVLEIGCGTSCLSEAMAADGYRDVSAIDVSPAVVEQMQARTVAQSNRSASTLPVHCVRYACMDASHMPDMHDRSFGAVVDKGTLDAVASQDAQKARQIFAEVMRVLREGGRAILISTMTVEVLHALLTPPVLQDHTLQDIVALKTTYGEDVRAFVVRKGRMPKADTAWGGIQGFLDTARAAVESGSLQALMDNDDYQGLPEVDTPPDDRRVSLSILSAGDDGVNVAYRLEDGGSWRQGDYVGMYAEGETDLVGGYRDFAFLDEGALEGSVMLRGVTHGTVVMAVSKAGSVLGTARVADVQQGSSPHAHGAGSGSEAVSGAMGKECQHEEEDEEGEEGEDAHVAMELQSMLGCWRVMAWAPTQTTHTTEPSSITHAQVRPLTDRQEGGKATKDQHGCSTARRGVHVSFKQRHRVWRADVMWPLGDGDGGGDDEEGWRARYEGMELETMDDHVSLRLPATPTRDTGYDMAAAIDAAPATLAARVEQMCSVSKEVGVHLTCRFCECRITTSPIHRALPLPSDRLDDVSEFLLCFADSLLPLTTQHIHSRPGLLLIGEGFVLLHGSSVACSTEGTTERSDNDVISCPRCDTVLGAKVKTEEGERHDDVRLWLHRLGLERQLPQSDEESTAEDVMDGHTVMTHVSSILRAACKRSKKRRFRILPEFGSAACRIDLKVWGQEVLYRTAGDTCAEPRAGMKIAYRVDYGEPLKAANAAEGLSAMESRNGCGGREKGGGGSVCGRGDGGHNHSHPSDIVDGGACGNGTCHGGGGSGGIDDMELLLPFDEWHAVAALLESSSSSVPPSCHLPFAPHRVAYLPLVPSSARTQPA